MKRHELTEEQWNKVKDLLPPEKPAHGGRPRKDNREMLNAILYWLNIPSRVNAKHPGHTDWHTYKERHLVENLFLKLKNNRRFVTRYEKKALYFHAVVCPLPVPFFGYSDGFKTDSRVF